MARTGTHYGKLCTLVRLAVCFTWKSRSTQNRCGVKYNIHFVANYENWFRNKKSY